MWPSSSASKAPDIRRWRQKFFYEMYVLRAAQRYISQIPDVRLTERAIDNRDRSIRLMSHPIFRIAEAFLES